MLRASHAAAQQQQQRKEYVAKQQRWLLFLRHCAKCQAPEGRCQYGQSCTVAKQLWRHILNCADPACEYPRCAPPRRAGRHCAPRRAAPSPQSGRSRARAPAQAGVTPGRLGVPVEGAPRVGRRGTRNVWPLQRRRPLPERPSARSPSAARARRCVTSRELLKHHQKCVNPACPVCTPVKQYVQKQRLAMQQQQERIQRTKQEAFRAQQYMVRPPTPTLTHALPPPGWRLHARRGSAVLR